MKYSRLEEGTIEAIAIACFVYSDNLSIVHFFSLMKRNEPKKNQDKTMLQRVILPHPRCFVGPALYTHVK
jgi:hypothetical protein